MTNEEAIAILDTIPTISEQVDAIEMAIEALQERKTGKWIVKKDCEGKTRTLICPFGKWKSGRYTWEDYNYCPNCGAKLEVDDTDEHRAYD